MHEMTKKSKKLRTETKKKPEKKDIPKIRSFFGSGTTQKYSEKSKIFVVMQLIQTQNYEPPVDRHTYDGNSDKKTSVPFKVIEAHNTHIDQIQLKYDSDYAFLRDI